MIDANRLKEYLPHFNSQLPSVVVGQSSEFDYKVEREMMYNVILELRNELDEVKKITMDLLTNKEHSLAPNQIPKIYEPDSSQTKKNDTFIEVPHTHKESSITDFEDIIEAEESHLTLQDQEINMIKKSLDKHKGKRKLAAKELGISERTLYRKIKQYNL